MYIYIYKTTLHNPFFLYRHLGHFCVLVLVNSAAMNTGVHASFQISGFSLGICPVVGLLGHMVVLILVF